jgi:hypothetical protein
VWAASVISTSPASASDASRAVTLTESPSAVKSATVESEPTAPTYAIPVWTPAPTERDRPWRAAGRPRPRPPCVRGQGRRRARRTRRPRPVDHNAVRAVVEAVHQPAELDRPHLLRERCRSAHVGEEHRDLDFSAAGVCPHERLAHVAVVRVLRGSTALEDEADHRCHSSAERHEAQDGRILALFDWRSSPNSSAER